MQTTAIKQVLRLALAGYALLCPLQSVAADVRYVSLDGQHLPPYTNWFSAATNIQKAVDASSTGDEIIVSNGLFCLSSQIVITQGVHVIGYEGSSCTTIDGDLVTRCFQIASSDAVVDGFTIKRGRADVGGGVLCTAGMLFNCVVESNSAFGAYSPTGGVGGGVYCGLEGVISNCLVAFNTVSNLAGGNGGGIFCKGGRVQRSIIEYNSTADQGGGGGIFVGYAGVVEDCTVRANMACGGAGVLCVSTGTLRRCTVSSNQTVGTSFPAGGGVLAVWDSIVDDCVIENNIASLYGGGVAVWGSLVTDCSIHGNSAIDAAGVFMCQGELMGISYPGATSRVANCVIDGNSAITNGGGIFCLGGTVLNCTISSNTAGSQGGGLYANLSTVSNCTFIGNAADLSGGGLHGDGVSVLNCTFERNSAFIGGGMTETRNGAFPFMRDCTFIGNVASAGGGACCGSLTNVSQTMTNLASALDSINNAVVQINQIQQFLTNMFSQLPQGLSESLKARAPGEQTRVLFSAVSGGGDPIGGDILRCLMVSNTADYGGGLFLLDTPDLIVSNCVLSDNHAQSGGGICAVNGGVFVNSILAGNDSSCFGGGAVVLNDGLLRDCNVVSNHANVAGGGAMMVGVISSPVITSIVTFAVSQASGSRPRVEATEFLHNSGGTMGGALFLVGGEVAENNLISRNCAVWGGGIAIGDGEVCNSRVMDNSASFGGGCFAIGGSVTNCALQGNNASWMGGGILAMSPSGGLSIKDCLVTDNLALAGGGMGLLMTAQVQTCRITNNTASQTGGGVLFLNGGDLQSSIVSRNTARDGGGVYCLNGGRLVNDTITDNFASNAAGGICVVTNVPGGPPSLTNATVRNTIIYGNTAPTGANFLNQGTNVNYSYCCTFPLPETGGEGNITNNPGLTPDNLLKSASPCIDAGSDVGTPATDMDGEARWDDPRHSNVVSIVDIGADEFVDIDLDSMADRWETSIFGSITNRNGTGDFDNDSLIDLAEYEHSTNPTNTDTDMDLLPDGWEVVNGLNPLSNMGDNGATGDPDVDGADNLTEYIADTQPTNADSVLRILTVKPEHGGMRIDWKGGIQAWQFLDCREDLTNTNEEWLPILCLPPPTQTTNAVIDMGVTNRAFFYRIRVER